MAFYNPHKIDFNPSNMAIERVGAIGKSLYEIYSDNVRRAQEQNKLDEVKRANLAQETHAMDVLNNTKDYQAKALKAQQDRFDWNKAQDETRNNQWQQNFNFQQQEAARKAAAEAENRAFNRFFKSQMINDRSAQAAERQRIENEKIATQNLQNDMIFSSLGGTLPQGSESWTPQQQAAYKTAWVGAQGNPLLTAQRKEQAELNADPLKNLPVSTQNRLNNAGSLLDRYNTYTQNLSENSSQMTGPIDVFTAPLGRASGLNSTALATAYADAEAIAEMERATTKGGGQKIKQDALDALDPVRVQEKTRVQNIAARIKNHITTYNETIRTLQAQGNYKGAQQLQAELNEKLSKLPQEYYTAVFDKNVQEKEQEKEQEIANIFKKRAEQGEADYYEQADEHGGRYLGNPLDEEF